MNDGYPHERNENGTCGNCGASAKECHYRLVPWQRVAYEQARDRLQHLIDHPKLTVSIAEYRAQLQAAMKASQDAHDAWMVEKA
jgi:hypothetical protein